MEKLIRVALALGWTIDSHKVLCPPMDSEPMLNSWCAQWKETQYDGRTILVPHWMVRVISEQIEELFNEFVK